MLDLYKNIKACRLQKKWSQDELAQRVGYSDKSMISKIEKGLVDLSQSQIIKFSEVFGVPASVLFGNTPSLTDLTGRDRHLIDMYHQLNDEGKDKLDERAEELIRMDYTVETEAKKEGTASA